MDNMDNKQTMQQKPSASDVARYLLEKKGTLTGYQLQSSSTAARHGVSLSTTSRFSPKRFGRMSTAR